MLNISQTALEQLSALLLERAGLKIAPDGYHGLKLAMKARLPALGLTDGEEYVKRLRTPNSGEQELRALLPFVTVGKTEFFRDPRQFRALEKRVLPDLLNLARSERRKISIWSAGCATGEEPYSLAMALIETGARPQEVDLLATDVNPAAIETAEGGRYPTRRLAGLSDDRRRRFFVEDDEALKVAPRVREYVRFGVLNLAMPHFAEVKQESLDLLLCRNVIIYFDLPTIRGLMDRFLAALRPGGLLFLGYSESLFKVYDKFEMVEVEGAFIYRRPSRPTTARMDWRLAKPEERPAPVPVQPAAPLVPPRTRTAETSIPALNGGTAPARTAAQPVTPAPRPPPESSAPSDSILRAVSAARSPEVRLKDVVTRMERGEFDAALTSVKQLTEDAPNDLDALLTLGNIYSLMGRTVEAQDVFAQAVTREPL
ncbi:MAG TPA: CheR family methyltransferase, partial [Myxococcaceae bacterium]|nr:CheR family methyltransferase [Myxococcaceae bacterium]